jgi:hypothetical protein
MPIASQKTENHFCVQKRISPHPRGAMSPVVCTGHAPPGEMEFPAKDCRERPELEVKYSHHFTIPAHLFVQVRA